jgi:pilus assembly protein CpaF
MSYLLSTVPNEKRIVTIENNVREFDLTKRDADGNVINNAVHLVTKDSENPSDRVDQEKLLEYALTMNPDVIVIGEAKSAEAMAAQEAARTGHAVLTTTHANSCESTYRRLVTLCKQKYGMDDLTLYNLVTEAFPVVVFTKKLDEDNSRKVTEIIECEITGDGKREIRTLFRFVFRAIENDSNGKPVVVGEFKRVHPLSKSLLDRLRDNGLPEAEYRRLEKEGGAVGLRIAAAEGA